MSERLAVVRRLIRDIDGLAVDVKTANLHHNLPDLVSDNLVTKIYELRGELIFLLDALREEPAPLRPVENEFFRRKRPR